MINKILKSIFIVLSLACFLLCNTVFADVTPEQEIVTVNGIKIYMIPAQQLINTAKEMNIRVSEKTVLDGFIEFTIANSRLLEEFLRLYADDIAYSQSRNNIVFIESKNIDDNTLLKAIVVNKNRSLVMAIEFSGGAN